MLRLTGLMSLCFLLLAGCKDEEDRFEVVKKLRGVGIRADKPVVSGADSVNIEIFALLPAGKSVSSAEVWTDDLSVGGLSPDLTVNDDATHTEHGALTLFRQTAVVSVPAVPQELLDSMNGVVRLRYGIRLREGDDEEIILGDILSVASGDASLNWTAPSLNLEAPSEGESLASPFELKASLTKNQEEPVKPLWMVSSGKVKNLRGLSTEWDEIEGGEQTILVGIFSKKSRFFTFEIRKVQGP